MNLTLSIIDYLLFALASLSTLYLLFFAIASKLRRPTPYPETDKRHSFAVVFPAYKEDRVIVQAVREFLKQAYPTDLYKVIVISDQMQPETNDQLAQLPICLLKADYTESSKAKALALAMKATANESYDMVVIMDADNTASPSFLHELNKAYAAGMKVIQAHRVAKNMNTEVAILDAVSEEINNSIFRGGHIAVGLSSALIGSGMAIDATWFRQHVNRLQTAGEDKEMEALLLKEGIHIAYLEHVRVEDEKTQKKEVIRSQRKRWLAAQFGSLSHTLPDLIPALLKGNIDYVDKIVQWMLPPRIILLAGILFFSLLTLVIQPYISIKWWGLFLILMLALCAAIPGYLANKKLMKAIWQIPSLAFIMAGNLFKLRGVNKKFIHTEHGT